MSGFFQEMSAVLERHGGTVEKYIGDAVMAVFGVPRLHEDDALRAVRAAEEMQGSLRGLNEELVGRFGIRLRTRIGRVLVARSPSVSPERGPWRPVQELVVRTRPIARRR